jgi:Domain of unknown function (DUF4349)
MRIIPFPNRAETSSTQGFHAELEAALNGEGAGPVAASWRELCEDVRALAPAMDPEFSRRLRARIGEDAERRAHPAGRAHRRPGWLSPHGRPQAVAGVVAVVVAVVVALVITAPWHAGTTMHAGRFNEARTAELSAPAKADARSAPESSPAVAGVAPAPSAPASASPASAPGREQQLAASITLAAGASEVQATADRVARLAVSEGGFVQNSHVQVQQTGRSEASLTLKLPSTKLNAALAGLAELAPVQAESQSLQDITNSYEAARRALADATAERQALLRALAAASTQAQIESLHAQLSQARGAIAQARSGLQAVSQRASNAEVEVSVTGTGHSAGGGLTFHRGLHDVGRVLTVALVALLIAIAVLVPLALLLAVLFAGRRAWRRYQRERALDPS